MGTRVIQTPAQVNRISNFFVAGNGIFIGVTGTSGAVQFPALPDDSPSTDVLITNAGSTTAFVTFGTTSPTAVIPTNGTPANGICILAGQTVVFCKGDATYIAAITASSTTTLYAYQGYGS